MRAGRTGRQYWLGRVCMGTERDSTTRRTFKRLASTSVMSVTATGMVLLNGLRWWWDEVEGTRAVEVVSADDDGSDLDDGRNVDRSREVQEEQKGRDMARCEVPDGVVIYL